VGSKCGPEDFNAIAAPVLAFFPCLWNDNKKEKKRGERGERLNVRWALGYRMHRGHSRARSAARTRTRTRLRAHTCVRIVRARTSQHEQPDLRFCA